MYEDFVKFAHDSLKPVMKLAENNTALTVKLLKSQSDNVSAMLQDNLSHAQALVEAKDLNVAVEMQQKYVEALNDKLVTVAKENTVLIEDAISEAGKIFEGSLDEAQAQVKKTVENIEKEINQAGSKAA
jgi:hypothetical protein